MLLEHCSPGRGERAPITASPLARRQLFRREE
jgi:hypothetical protein